MPIDIHNKRMILSVGEEESLIIADSLNMDRSFLTRTLQLANLALDIEKMIWENHQPTSLSLEKLRRGIPESWEEQCKLFLSE